MGFINDMFNSTIKSVESKVVANRVRKMLDKVDTDSMETLFDASANLYSTAIVAGGEVIINLFKDNKEELVTLAENNSDAVIKLAGILQQLKPIITSLNNETNRDSIKKIKDTSITTMDKVTDEYKDDFAGINKDGQSAITTIIESLGLNINTDKEPQYYSILVDDELVECTIEHFEQRKRNVIELTGTFKFHTSGNHTFQVNDTTSTYHQNMGISK